MYFHVIFNILSELVTLHSQLLIYCIIVANVEDKASSSIFCINNQPELYSCTNSEISNKLLKLKICSVIILLPSNPAQRKTTVTLWGNLNSVQIHCDINSAF